MASNQFSRLYDVERVGGDQRTRLAELLRSQGMNPAQGQMVSGWYVPPSWSQNLNSALQMGLGTYMGSKIDEERKAETARLLRELGQGVEVPVEQKPTVFNNLERVETEGQTPAAQMSAPNQIQQLAGRMPASTEQSNFNPAITAQPQQPQFRPLTEDEKIGRVMQLAQINPAMANVWSAQDTARQNRLNRAEERAADREWKEGQAKERFAERMDLARFAMGNRPEKMVTLMDAEGNPYTTYQSQMQPGSVIYNPTTAKQFKERQSQKEGKELASDQIQNLRTQYDILNENYGITSEQNRLGSNIGAYLSGTGVGQALGRIGGSKNATARDVIRMSRPALMQTLVKASGISAKQIDSNAEAKMMLDQATDPDAGYEANQTALNYLEDRFIGKKPSSSNW